VTAAPDGAAEAAGNATPTLEAIAGDRRRGASEVAESLLAWGKAWGGAEGDASPGDVHSSLARLARTQAALAPVLRIANEFLVEIERREGSEEDSIRRAVGSVAGRWRSRLHSAANSLDLHLRRAIGGAGTVYTYSASATVRTALEAHAATGAWFRVVVSEGRPGLDEPGIVLVGADALLPARWVNKIGTGLLAARAKERGIGVVCAADTSKFLPTALAALPRSYDRDPAEIAAERPPSMEVENPYFEEIDYEALDRLVTERGPTRPRDLRVGAIPVARALR